MTTSSLVNPGEWPEAELPAFEQTKGFAQVDLWRKIVLWTVAGYLILNAGFEMVCIPSAGAVAAAGEVRRVLFPAAPKENPIGHRAALDTPRPGMGADIPA